MGSRYLFIVLYVFLEHHLSRGDYRRRDVRDETERGAHAVGDSAPDPPFGIERDIHRRSRREIPWQ